MQDFLTEEFSSKTMVKVIVLGVILNLLSAVTTFCTWAPESKAFLFVNANTPEITHHLESATFLEIKYLRRVPKTFGSPRAFELQGIKSVEELKENETDLSLEVIPAPKVGFSSLHKYGRETHVNVKGKVTHVEVGTDVHGKEFVTVTLVDPYAQGVDVRIFRTKSRVAGVNPKELEGQFSVVIDAETQKWKGSSNLSLSRSGSYVTVTNVSVARWLNLMLSPPLRYPIHVFCVPFCPVTDETIPLESPTVVCLGNAIETQSRALRGWMHGIWYPKYGLSQTLCATRGVNRCRNYSAPFIPCESCGVPHNFLSQMPFPFQTRNVILGEFADATGKRVSCNLPSAAYVTIAMALGFPAPTSGIDSFFDPTVFSKEQLRGFEEQLFSGVSADFLVAGQMNGNRISNFFEVNGLKNVGRARISKKRSLEEADAETPAGKKMKMTTS